MKPPARRAIRVGALAGLGIGVGLLALTPGLPEIAPKFPLQPAEWWKGLLASASAGVNEEIWFRLGIMTTLVAAGMAVFRRASSGAGQTESVASSAEAVSPAVEPVSPTAQPVPIGVGADEGASSAIATPVHASGWMIWSANAVAALLFGAVHLPQAELIAGLSAPVVAFTLIGNGIAGMAFGWLYWKRGLVSAIAAHFSTDIILHVIAPLAGT